MKKTILLITVFTLLLGLALPAGAANEITPVS